MMEQAGVFRASVCAAVVCAAAAVCAQVEAQPAAADGQAPAEQQPVPVKLFDVLVRVVNVQSPCDVLNPDVGQYAPAQNNKAYPLGTVIRTGPGGSALLMFSAQESAQVLENTEVVIGRPEGKEDARFVRLVAGKVKTTLRDNLPEESFSLLTPNAACKNLAGRGDFSLATDATLETFQAATVTGSARVEGPHYAIPALRAANTVHIQTAADRSLSRLTSVSGDFAILLSNGTEAPVNFGMSPKAVVKIWRENAPVGGRAIISTLVVSPTGKARHRFAYAEGRNNLTTGELISQNEDEEEQEKLPVLLPQEPAPAAEQPAPEATL